MLGYQINTLWHFSDTSASLWGWGIGLYHVQVHLQRVWECPKAFTYRVSLRQYTNATHTPNSLDMITFHCNCGNRMVVA